MTTYNPIIQMLSKLYRFVNKMQVHTHKPFGKELGKNELKISICDQNKEIATVFARIFAAENNVEILCGNLLNLIGDAVVSPANSFGDMGGGVDKAIDDFFAGEAQRKVQQHIQTAFYGEIPVGVASILPMNSQQFPFLIIAPTMRIPGNVSKTIHAYLAMRAVLVAVLQHNQLATKPIRHVILTSMCTGVGGMPFVEAAEQMRTALSSIIHETYKQVVHPAMAPYALGAKWILSEK
jgi:O-acetyl-ADP-ribose deacetylase (regulator of RNase III)